MFIRTHKNPHVPYSPAAPRSPFIRYSLFAIRNSLLLLLPACVPGARLQLSAADSLELLTRSVEQAVDEYNVDIKTADAQRRTDVVDAFVRRIRTDHASDDLVTRHESQFNDALTKLLNDADTTNQRRSATIDNLKSIREVAAGLRKIGIQSMSLDDETRRYVTDLIRTPTVSAEPTKVAPTQSTTSRR